jgi:hypothetical protein
MNLHDCRVPYTVGSVRLLRLRSQVAYLSALDLFRKEVHVSVFSKPRGRSFLPRDGTLVPGFPGYTGQYSPYLNESLSRYQQRKRADVGLELERTGIAERDSLGTLRLLPVPKDERVCLPTRCNYADLTLGALKTLTALHSIVRFHRTGECFRETCTQQELAGAANLSERKLRDALTLLTSDGIRLLEVRKSRKPGQEGTRFTLLDPSGSGATLFDIGDFYRQMLDGLPPYDRYRICLDKYDTQSLLKETRPKADGTGASLVRAMCPFCHTDKSLRFTATTDKDSWTCFAKHCRHYKNGGDSARLWALLRWKIDMPSFEASMAVISNRPKSIPRAVPAEPEYEATHGMDDLWA